MIRDFERDGARADARYDVVVVGSGPAGATVVAELAGRGLSIAVLESGRPRRTAHADALKQVESVGVHVKDYSRERVLGGASTSWAGLSSPLDPIDFRRRDWVPGSGWPIDGDELRPYYDAAAERYRFPAADRFTTRGIPELRAGAELRLEWRELEEKVFLAAEPPQDFGKEQRATYDRDDVDVYVDASVVELHADGDAVTAARVRGSGGREERVTARAFVLATGGIENARLLLLSRDRDAAGLGNAHDQVGRCFMNHPKNYHGILHLARPVDELPYYFGCLSGDFAGYAGIRFREDRQAERRVLNSYVRFEPLFPWSGSEGVESLVWLVKHSAFLLRAWKRRHKDEVVPLRDYAETGDDSDMQNARKGAGDYLRMLWWIVRDAPAVCAYAYHRVVSRARTPVRRVRLRNFMEMQPHADNRVVLSDRVDAHGTPLPRVEHAPTELDRRSLVELHDALRDELAAQGVGELRTDLATADPWPIDQDASHHMGTTRMGDDPRASVVDADLRVHGVRNLYCAGASVFPTSGCANPTFTIVALSIRLARHLERALRPDAAAREEVER